MRDIIDIFGIREINELKEDYWKINESYILRPIRDGVVIKGLCHPSSKRITIYYANCMNQIDGDSTLVHECIHAVNPYLHETAVELYGTYIAFHFPEVTEYLKETFDLKGWRYE